MLTDVMGPATIFSLAEAPVGCSTFSKNAHLIYARALDCSLTRCVRLCFQWLLQFFTCVLAWCADSEFHPSKHLRVDAQGCSWWLRVHRLERDKASERLVRDGQSCLCHTAIPNRRSVCVLRATIPMVLGATDTSNQTNLKNGMVPALL